MIQVWDLLVSAGGSLALSFIVAIGLGMCGLALLFAGSAVVMLDRFARTPPNYRLIAFISLIWTGLVSPLFYDTFFSEPEISLRLGQWMVVASSAGLAFGSIVLAQLLVGILLYILRPAILAQIVTVFLLLGYGLLVGGAGKVFYILVAAAILATAFLFGKRKLYGLGDIGRTAWSLVAVLVISLGTALSGPWFLVSQAGALSLYILVGAIVLGLVPLAAAGFLELRGSSEWFIATRYLFAKRRQTLISVITVICVVGVAAGVWLIITVLSVMNGFERTWRDEIIGNRAHLTVHSPSGLIEDYSDVLERIDQVPDVIGASAYVDAEGMVRGLEGEVVAIKVRGIDPDRVVRVTDLQDDLIEGSKQALTKLTEDASSKSDDPSIIVGNRLAATLSLAVGDVILIVAPFGGPPTPFGPGPRLKRFRVAGVFESSFFQYDEIYTYTHLDSAQEFRRLGDAVTGIEVRTSDLYRSQAVGKKIERALGYEYFTRDWKEFFPAFFQALKTERVMMFVLLGMIMVVAAFAIVVTLVMMIVEKSSDIAILKAMGASNASIELIFAIEGVLIGLVGTVLGVIAGIAFTTRLGWIQSKIEIITGIDTLPASVYQFSELPWELDVGQIAIVVIIAMILSLGATLLPSRHGACVEPSEALRYE